MSWNSLVTCNNFVSELLSLLYKQLLSAFAGALQQLLNNYYSDPPSQNLMNAVQSTVSSAHSLTIVSLCSCRHHPRCRCHRRCCCCCCRCCCHRRCCCRCCCCRCRCCCCCCRCFTTRRLRRVRVTFSKNEYKEIEEFLYFLHNQSPLLCSKCDF